jgi:hypothetical protein
MSKQDWKQFGCEYTYQGGSYHVVVIATDREDAEARCRALRTATLIGEIGICIPVPTWADGIVVGILRWLGWR